MCLFIYTYNNSKKRCYEFEKGDILEGLEGREGREEKL